MTADLQDVDGDISAIEVSDGDSVASSGDAVDDIVDEQPAVVEHDDTRIDTKSNDDAQQHDFGVYNDDGCCCIII